MKHSGTGGGMMGYPFVVNHTEYHYRRYNGFGFGRTEVGLTVLEKHS